MKLNKEIFSTLLILLLLNVHVINSYKSSKIGDAMRLNAKKGQNERLKNKVKTNTSVVKKRDFGLTMLIIGLVIIGVALIAAGLKGYTHVYQREVLEKIKEEEEKLFNLNLEICASSTLTNLRLRSSLALKIFTIEVSKKAVEDLTKQDVLFKKPNVIPEKYGFLEEPSNKINTNKASVETFVTKVTKMNDDSDKIKKLEKSAEDVCSYYTTGTTLEDIGNKIQDTYDNYNLKDEIFDVLSIIFNVTNDIGMILTGTGFKNSTVAKFANSDIYRGFNGANASLSNVADYIETLSKTTVEKANKNPWEIILSTLAFITTLIWGAFYMSGSAQILNNQIPAIVEITTSLINILNKFNEFKNREEEEKKGWYILEFAESLMPDIRTIFADIPNAFCGGSDGANKIFGFIALFFDIVQVLLKLANAIGGLYRTVKQKNEAIKASEELLKKKKIEHCETQNNYLEYFMKINKEDSSDKKIIDASSVDISQGPLNLSIRKTCQTSIFSCLKVQYKNENVATGKIFTDAEYKDLLYNFRRGPIQSIVISRNFQYDDDFMRNGYRVMTRTYMNMNNILFCRSCENNIVIKAICFYDRKTKNFYCPESTTEDKNTDLTNVMKDTFEKRNTAKNTNYLHESLENKGYTFKVIRILYNYDLIYLEETFELTENDQDTTINALTRMYIKDNAGKPQLSVEYRNVKYKIKNSLVFFENPEDSNNLEQMKNNTKISIEKKFSLIFTNEDDPMAQIKEDFCEKVCLNKEPRYEEFGCGRQFYNHYGGNSKEFKERLKVMHDYCDLCPALPQQPSYQLIMDNQVINDEKMYLLRSLNGKFMFRHEILTQTLQIIDLDYKIGQFGLNHKVIKEIHLIKSGSCSKSNEIKCRLDIVQAIVCKQTPKKKEEKEGEKKIWNVCWAAVKLADGQSNSTNAQVIEAPHMMMHDHGILDVIYKSQFKTIWTFGDIRITQSWLAPGEYAEQLDSKKTNLAVYDKYRSNEDTIVTKCFFNLSPKSHLFTCSKNKTINFFQMRHFNLAPKGGEKQECTFIDKVPQTGANEKKFISYLNGGRLVNKKNGDVVILSYKNKPLWSLFDPSDIKFKTVIEKKPGSRLVLKNQIGEENPVNSSGSLSVYWYNTSHSVSAATNPTIRIVEILTDLDAADKNFKA